MDSRASTRLGRDDPFRVRGLEIFPSKNNDALVVLLSLPRSSQARISLRCQRVQFVGDLSFACSSLNLGLVLANRGLEFEPEL